MWGSWIKFGRCSGGLIHVGVEGRCPGGFLLPKEKGTVMGILPQLRVVFPNPEILQTTI